MFKQSPLFPCVIPIDQMKRCREKKEEDVGFHQCVADAFRNFCLSSLCFSRLKRLKRREHSHAWTSSARVEDFLPLLPWLLYVTHSLAKAAVVAHGQHICHPFALQKAHRSKLRLRMNGGNTYSFFSRAKSSCSPSTSIRSFSDAGCFWRDNKKEKN